MSVYNLSGVEIANRSNDNYSVSRFYRFNTMFYVINIFKTKTDGTKQYPFIFAPFGITNNRLSTLDMNSRYGFDIAVNAGRFFTEGTDSGRPLGLLIENGVLLQQGDPTQNWLPLTIDLNGDLGYCTNRTDGNELVNNGIISAVNGWTPIIENYAPKTDNYYNGIDVDESVHAQRQLFGQYGNGDYCIITTEGRNHDNSVGVVTSQLWDVCQEMGLKFVYVLDGGGSTETVIGKKQLNKIYEQSTGRLVPNYIVFNGTTVFPG